MRNLAAIAVFILFYVGIVSAQDTKPTKPKELPPWRLLSDAVVRQHTIEIPGDKSTKVKIVESPVFIHNINVDVESHAVVYLWITEIGRPVAAITAIMMRYDQNVDLWNQIDEYHSFHDDSIVARRSGRKLWAPEGPGVDWTEIPDAPLPAKTAIQQGIQAKTLSRRFSVTAVYNRKDGRPWELRLITTPIHKYATKNDGQVVSGFLHVFCRATDPEAMLAIEVRKNGKGEFRWHYAPANYSDAGAYLMLDGKQVWKEDPARFGSNYRHFGYGSKSDFSLAAELQSLKSQR